MHMSTIFFMTVAHLFSKRETPLPLSQVVGEGRGGINYGPSPVARVSRSSLASRLPLLVSKTLKNNWPVMQARLHPLGTFETKMVFHRSKHSISMILL